MIHKRKSGVLLPVFSLPGDFGCGTFGDSAYRWIDILSESGFSYWQVLPFGICDDHNSPYMSYSSFGGNPLFIDPETLYRQGLITKAELDSQRVSDPYLCQYALLKEKRMDFFRRISETVRDPSDILDFAQKHPEIRDTCRFLALKKANNGATWQEWTVKDPDPKEEFAQILMQYHFHQQWERLHRYAALKGISVIGDLPFYVSQNSYDVYSAPDKFQLDEAYEPAFVAGVPPDYFSEEGQRWGNPLYRWETMKEDGFLWWKKRLSYMLSLFDGLRIDHFRAIAAYWSIPAREKSAKAGEWKKGPGRDLIDAIREVAGEQLILAEDLGIIDEATKELLRYSGFPGMGVFQFGFDGNPNSVHLPHNYRENQVVYSGTHDNNTLLGFLWEADDELRDSILDYLGYPADGCEGVLRALMMSRAGIVIFPFQDLMKFGADTRINTPGRAAGNWQYRITREQMEKLDRQKYLHLNRIYSRTP